MKNKKISRVLSAVLVSAMIVGGVASCSKEDKKPNVSDGVNAAVTEAETYVTWLTERLGGDVKDPVVLGLESSDDYGIDMTDFEDDGYIIRKDDNVTLIFGKTADGLDRGVRKYANTVDAGEAVSEVRYHEGARIDSLKLFGTDISEFEIVYSEDHNDNMKFAAEEMQQLLKKATGHELSVVKGKSDKAHKIELRHSTDEELKEDGYRYFEENGNLVIEGAVARGCSNGVYRFLDNELGWECLVFGDSYLPEADKIEIPAGLNKTETPIMDYLYVHTNEWNKYVTDRTEVAWNAQEMSYGPYDHAHHGMSRYDWAITPVNYYTSQLCHTRRNAIEYAYEQIITYIEKHEKEGGVVGYTLKDIDVSQGDNNRYCICTDCSKVMSYDKSTAGPVLQFANEIAERLEADGYEGMAVHIFAYFSTKKPPEVTTAHPNVHITFAQNGNCSNHSMYGEECVAHEDMDKYPQCRTSYFVSDSNADNDRWLSKWCEISDNVVIWYYALDTVLHQYSILDFLLDDFRYMNEHGIRGMFWQITHHGFGVKRVEQQLGVEINWNKDMTDEEYEEELCRLLEREYGPGWKYVREYLDYMIEATDRIGCFNCWGYGNNEYAEYDYKYMAETYKSQIELIDKAISMAGSADEEYRCKLLSCSIYYSSVFSQYFEAYENEDTEKLAELEELYNTVYNRIVELGFNPEEIVSVDGGKCKVWSELEKEAWIVWKGNRETHVGKTDGLRAEPSWIAEYEATITTAE